MDLPLESTPWFALRRTAWLLALLCLSGSAARADEPPAATASAGREAASASEYERTIDAAVAEHDAGHFTEARAQFLRAHELSPSARTLRGLGMVEFELRNYGESVRYLEQALASEDKRLEGALRGETELLLKRARAYVGEVHVAVEPGTAKVMVDGVTVASGPQASFTLVVGDHELEFRAHGRLPEKRAVRIRGGEETSIRVVLAPPEADDQRPAFLTVSSAPEKTEVAPLRKKWWLWTAVGIVAVGTAVGLTLGLRGEDRVRTEGPVGTSHTPPDVVISTLVAR